MEQEDIQAVVNDAIAKAATPQPPVMTGMAKQLEALRITSQTPVTPHKFLYTMFGIPCFARGELVMITGKKKCGKTFFSTILMTLGQCRRVLTMQRVEPKPLVTLYLDTEQGTDTTQELLEQRILPMVENQLANDGAEPFTYDDELQYFHALNMRCVPWNDRMPMVEAAIRMVRPDLVIIDGIRDVVDDINNGMLAQQVTEALMRLAQEVNCCIVSVLHQNKAAEDRTPRGALGTEYGNKCFEEWEMKKEIESGMVVFTITQTATRKYDITNKFQFTVDPANGLPIALTNEQQLALEQAQQRPAIGGAAQQPQPGRRLNYDYVDANGRIDVVKAFSDVLQGVGEMRATVLQERFMQLVGIDHPGRYAACRREAIESGLLVRVEHDPKNVSYQLAQVPAEV